MFVSGLVMIKCILLIACLSNLAVSLNQAHDNVWGTNSIPPSFNKVLE